jgi:hypothetical protein
VEKRSERKEKETEKREGRMQQFRMNKAEKRKDIEQTTKEKREEDRGERNQTIPLPHGTTPERRPNSQNFAVPFHPATLTPPPHSR